MRFDGFSATTDDLGGGGKNIKKYFEVVGRHGPMTIDDLVVLWPYFFEPS